MILIVTEHQDSKFKPITSELIVFAQRLGRDLEQPVTAVVMGSGVGDLAAGLGDRKLDRLITIEDENLAEYNPDGYVAALRQLIEKETPFLVLTGATTTCRGWLLDWDGPLSVARSTTKSRETGSC